MDEKKTFLPGKTEISSEEYRDIISRLVLADAEVDRLRVENWKLADRCRVLESELAECRAKSRVKDDFMGVGIDDGK